MRALDSCRLPRITLDGHQDGAGAQMDRSVRFGPVVGRPSGPGMFTIPKRPIRRRMPDVPPFVVTRGGEYCFAPGLRALRWLGDLDSE